MSQRRFGQPQPLLAAPARGGSPAGGRLVSASGAPLSGEGPVRRQRPPSRFLQQARRAQSARDIFDPSALTRNLFARRLPTAERFRQHYGRIDMALIQEVLRAADVGIMTPIADLSRESLALDPHCSSLPQKRFGALSALQWKVEAADGEDVDQAEAERVAADVRHMLGKIRGWRQAIYDIAWSLFDGRGALEIDWAYNVNARRPYRPLGLDWLHPRRIAYGPDRELRLINTFTSGRGWWAPNGAALRDYPGKFLSWEPRYFCDYPEREGLGRRSLYWLLFKRFSARMRMILTELFAIPWRTVTFPQDTEYHQTSWEDLDDAEDRAEALGGENTVAMPPGAELKVEWPGENTGQLFEMTRMGVNEEMSKLWVLNVATTDAKPDALGGGAAKVHKGEQNIALDRDAFGIGEVFQECLVDVYVLLNYGPDHIEYSPRVTLASADEIDRTVEQTIMDTALVNVPVGLGTYYERIGVPQPDKDEPVIVMRPDASGTAVPQIIYPPGWEGPRVGEPPPAPPSPPGAPPGGGAEPSGGNGSPGSPAPAFGPPAADSGGAGHAAPTAPDAAEGLLRSTLGLSADRHQRATVNGTEDELVARGVKEGVRSTSVWAQTLVDSIDDAGTHLDAHAALSLAAASLSLEAFARSVERTTVLSLALGALDAAWETAADSAPVAASGERAGAGLILGSPLAALEIPRFTTKPFAEAISSFLGKKIVSRRVWDRLAGEAKRRAFTVSGLARTGMLEVAHDELTKGIAEGIDLRTFRQRLAERFESNGWTMLNKSRVETVFRTNVAGAYASGRDVQQREPAVLAARPFWQIRGVNDDRTRDTHKAAHGKVLAASDPFWMTTPLPWGFNERCYRSSRSAADVQRLGLQVTTGASITGLPDDGFDGGKLLALFRDRAGMAALFVYAPSLYAEARALDLEPPITPGDAPAPPPLDRADPPAPPSGAAPEGLAAR